MAAQERQGVVTFQGSSMTLEGPELNVGDTVPDVETVGANMAPIAPLAASAGKTRLFIAIPSVDTSVCSLETRTFSRRAPELGDDVAVYAVSGDLPFAQSRWCGAEGVENVTMLSDYRDHALGRAWGLALKEMGGLLARAVYVVDKNDRVAYREIVDDISREPNYDAAIEAAKAASGVR